MLRLTSCSCGVRQLLPIEGSAWMTFFPRRRLYRCTQCGTRQFLKRLPAWVVPPVAGIEPIGPITCPMEAGGLPGPR